MTMEQNMFIVILTYIISLGICTYSVGILIGNYKSLRELYDLHHRRLMFLEKSLLKILNEKEENKNDLD